MANDAPFSFDGCKTAAECRPAMEAMIPKGADWVEIQCGRCKATGILRRASDAAPAAPAKGSTPAAAATPPAPESAA